MEFLFTLPVEHGQDTLTLADELQKALGESLSDSMLIELAGIAIEALRKTDPSYNLKRSLGQDLYESFYTGKYHSLWSTTTPEIQKRWQIAAESFLEIDR